VEGERHAAAWWAETLRENAAGPVAAVVTELAVAPLPEDRPEALGNYARGVLLSLIQMGLTRQIADLRGRLQRTAPDSEEAVQIFAELVALEDRRHAMRAEDRRLGVGSGAVRRRARRRPGRAVRGPAGSAVDDRRRVA